MIGRWISKGKFWKTLHQAHCTKAHKSIAKTMILLFLLLLFPSSAVPTSAVSSSAVPTSYSAAAILPTFASTATLSPSVHDAATAVQLIIILTPIDTCSLLMQFMLSMSKSSGHDDLSKFRQISY